MMDAATDVKPMMFIHQTQLQHGQHDNSQMVVHNHMELQVAATLILKGTGSEESHL